MTDGFMFDGLDIAGAEELGTGVPNGVYTNAYVSGSEVWFADDGERRSLKISYTVPGYDFPVTEYKDIPIGRESSWDRNVVDDKGRTEYDRKMKSKSFLKARLADLGVPYERMNSLRPGDLDGIQVTLTVVRQKNNPQYAAVGRVQARNPVPPTTQLPKASLTVVHQNPVTATTTNSAATGPVDNPFA